MILKKVRTHSAGITGAGTDYWNKGGLQCGGKETTQLKNIIYIKFP